MELDDIQDSERNTMNEPGNVLGHRDRRDIYNHLEGFSLLYVKRISFLL